MGYIFEAEIERIMNTVRARTIGEADTITLRDILTSKIHPAIKAYFKAEVERQLKEERQLEVRSRKFSYSIPEVTSLQRQMDLQLMVHYQFDQHEFDTLIDQAVHFTFNFLCRPQFTLMEFLFENQRHQSTSSIEQKLSYCVDYGYFSLLLKRYFTERGLAAVSYEEFKELLAKIDSEVVSTHSSFELANMTRAIVGFVEAVEEQARGQEKASTLPINAAIVFFEDKNLSEIKLRLEYERDHNHLVNISIQRLAEIIEEVRAITSGRQLEPVDGDAAPPIPPSDQNRQIVPEVERSDGGEGWREQNGALEYKDDTVPASSPAESRMFESVSSRSLGASAPVSDRLPDVNSLLSDSEKKKIVKKIFHKDEDEFHITLDLLSQATTWEEASLILDDLFLAKGIDPQSKIAILLTEKLFGRYHPVSD